MAKVYLVCGGREFSDRARMYEVLGVLPIGAIVHGDARGADRMAGEWAHEHGIPEIRVPANWDFHGNAAGPRRNGWMLKYVRIDEVIAFPGGGGTEDMVVRAAAAGIPVRRVI